MDIPDNKFNLANHLQGKELFLHLPYIYLNRTPEIQQDKPFLIYILGPSGVGKDTFTREALSEGLASFARSSTNRPQRIEPTTQLPDPNDNYIWMRARAETETDEEYKDNLIKEYDLVELTLNNSYLYGMPRESLINDQGKPVIIINSIPAFEKSAPLFKDDFNILSIFLLPDNMEQLYSRMQGRNDILKRMNEALSGIQHSANLVNFFIHNAEGSETNPLPAKESFKALISYYMEKPES